MNSDFYDAHLRHLEDAGILYESSRFANADQLFGLAAECGLKKLMIVFGMPFDSTKDIPQSRDDKVHINGCWDRYESYRSGHHAGTHYGLIPVNPFANWNISDRYAHQSNFSQAYVDPHKMGANEIKKLVAKAKLEGLI